jgi:YVTN family beta-propeller protein
LVAARVTSAGLFVATLLVGPATVAYAAPSGRVANTATNTAGPPIKVGISPNAIAITPNGKTAYVVDLDYYGSGIVTPINTATNTAGRAINVGLMPNAIAIAPNGKTAYVVDSYGTVGTPINTVTVTPINIATNTAGPAIKVGKGGVLPIAIAITPNSKTTYVVNSNSGTVTPISTATNTAGPAITVGQQPSGSFLAS